jgi:translation initiation factor 3 subunit A
LQPSVVYQQRLLEERKIYENEQQREVERLKSDLKEKKRLARMLDNKEIFRVIRLRQPEFERLRSERSILVK